MGTPPADKPAQAECQPCKVMDSSLAELKRRVYGKVRGQIDHDITGGSHAPSPAVVESLRTLVTNLVLSESSALQLVLSHAQHHDLINLIASEIIGYGAISSLLGQDRITEIMINGPDEVYVEEDGQMRKCGIRFDDEAHVRAIAERIAVPLGRRLDAESPLVDARLPDGSRVNIAIPPASLRGTMITIRKFRREMLAIDDLIRAGSIDRRAADFLAFCVRARLNLIVSGGTGSGKTTMLNIISRFIPAGERVITIEDAAELQLNRENVGIFEARPPDLEGRGEITTRQLLRNALRMRPDRIIIGELRGDETFDMLQAMNTGHDGSMTTIHANSARDALRRLETNTLLVAENLALSAIRAQIASAIQLVIQTQRMTGGKRLVAQISEITGMEGPEITMQDIFVLEQAQLRPSGLVPRFIDQLKAKGLEIPQGMFNP